MESVLEAVSSAAGVLVGSLPAALAAGAVFAVAGVLLAARRSARQPLPYDAAAEQELVELLEAHPGLIGVSSELSSGATGSDVRLPETRLPETRLPETRLLEIVSLVSSSALSARLEDAISGWTSDGMSADVDAEHVPDVARESFVRVYRLLADLAEDRVRFRGASDWVYGPDGVPVRTVSRPSSGRLALFAVLGAAGGFAAFGFAGSPAAAVSVLLMVLAASVVSCVDSDTLLIDMPSLFVLGVPAVVLAALAHGMSSSALWLLAGSAVLPLALFLVASAVFVRLRGMSGLGAGDLVVSPVAFAVPVLLSGTLLVLPLLLWVASTSAVLAHVAARLVRPGDTSRTTPLAFGPHLMWSFLPGLLFGPAALRLMYGI